jgi:hypothetical protein
MTAAHQPGPISRLMTRRRAGSQHQKIVPCSSALGTPGRPARPTGRARSLHAHSVHLEIETSASPCSPSGAP